MNAIPSLLEDDHNKGVPASPSDQSGSAPSPEGLGHTATVPNAAFERRVDFIPAFDRRDPNPSRNYGLGSMRIRFVLKGELGAVQWMIGTSWDVESARKPTPWRDGTKPDGWDLGYHSPRPLYEGQTHMDSCDVLPGPCYYDGSGLNAELLIENFISQGTDYVWKALEAYYRCTFEDADWPFDDSGNLKASAIEAFGQDAKRLDVEHESAVPQGDAR